MTLSLRNIIIDVEDLDRAVAFWTAALAYKVAHRWPFGAALVDPAGEGLPLGLQLRHDAKTDVNRVHLDLQTEDIPGEVARLLGLGATEVQDWDYPPDAPWVVLADPDGNEFCVVPPATF